MNRLENSQVSVYSTITISQCLSTVVVLTNCLLLNWGAIHTTKLLFLVKPCF